ncbi:hypothetical protein F4679DRAFT_573681 [Xylaria curta]|nr:hypothetical protein F4679DRAFT_573681 [Xylaria curta]
MPASLDSLYLFSPEIQNAILNGPALAPPQADIVPNFEHPPNMNVFAQAITTTALVLVTIVIVLRAYAKICIVGKLQLQDYFAFLAYLCFIGGCYSLYRLAAGVGFFVHQWNVLVRDVNEIIFVSNQCFISTFQIGVNFYSAANLFIKTSILLECLQTFAPRGTRLFWVFHVIIWFNALFCTSIEIAVNLTCVPFNRTWDKRILGVCFNRRPLDLTSAGANLICNIVILLAPQSVIWQLQLTTAKKIGVSIKFAIALFAIASATGRLVATELYSTSPDFTYEVSKAGLSCLAELSSAFFVLSVPILPGIFKGPNVLGCAVRSMFSCSLLYSKTSDTSGPQKLQVDDKMLLVDLPAKTYQLSNAMENGHLHSLRNDGSLTRNPY